VKPGPLGYHRATSVPHAVQLLSAYEGTARVIAGGQSLVPMLNMRLIQPDALIDVNGVAELAGIRTAGDATVLGALVRYTAIEESPLIAERLGLLARMVRHVGDRQVRNRGTIGGSLALSDPAGDWVTVLPALDAEVRLVGPAGMRTVAAADFTTGIYETARGPDEILESVAVPRLSLRGRWGFSRFARKTGDFAVSLAAAVHDPGRGYARIVLGGLDGAPVVLAQASAALKRGAAAAAVAAAARADLADAGLAFDAWHSSVHGAMIARAVAQVVS
jgi:carbon-monoxide dehydrogenase medium subunit